MALSFSRPDPSSPDSVAKAAFSTGRRGYEQNEVRDFLRMVAAELARLQERERFLDRELRSAQRSAPAPAAVLDEEVVTRMLGEEAARILSTSRDAAAQIKARAEESASRLLREAGDEAQRVREEANVEAARRRQDAAADAESELQMAKQQGREMVNEARTYRERVLSELARRREAARLQIEQLVHGRDRLLQAFERARLAAVDVMSEMTPLGEPSEYVNLSPTTGPVPVMVPNRPLPPRAAPPESPDEGGGVVVSMFAGELDGLSLVPADDTDTAAAAGVEEHAAAEQAEPADVEPPAAEDDVAVEDEIDEEQVEVVEDEHVAEEIAEEIDEGHVEADEVAEAPVVEEEALVQEEALVEDEATVVGDRPVDDELEGYDQLESDDDEIDDDEVDADAVDDLFARLRAARAESVAQRAGLTPSPPVTAEADSPGPTVAAPDTASSKVDEDATRALIRPEDLSVFAPSPQAPAADTEVDDSPFGQRDAVLDPLNHAVARKLKRVLADEQNEVQHALRAKGKLVIDVLLPAPDAHGERYLHAVADELHLGALAGARSLNAADDDAMGSRLAMAKVTTSASEALVARIVVPLRNRLARAVADADGDRDELASLARGIYREWKIQHIDGHVDDVVRIAFGSGALAGVEPGTPVQWIHDPNATVCADCDDNALSGVVGAGDEFATGQSCAPAHEGCRCMLAIAPR